MTYFLLYMLFSFDKVYNSFDDKIPTRREKKKIGRNFHNNNILDRRIIM